MLNWVVLNTCMEDELDFFVRRSTTELMLALYNIGYRTVPVGAMMRIIGVDDEYAAEYDDKVVRLDEDFAKYLQIVLESMVEDTDGDHILH